MTKKIAKFEFHELITFMKFNKYFKYDKYNIKLTSQRYKLFQKQNPICVNCGLGGTYFWLEQHTDEPPHFNLYGIKDNKEIMLTKDHIIPKSEGGKNILSNYQILCVICNQIKGNNNK